MMGKLIFISSLFPPSFNSLVRPFSLILVSNLSLGFSYIFFFGQVVDYIAMAQDSLRNCYQRIHLSLGFLHSFVVCDNEGCKDASLN